MSGLTKFIEKVGKDGIALQSKYRVDISIPQSLLAATMIGSYTTEDISLYCHMTSIPKVSMNTSNIKTYGPARQYAYERSSSESIPMLFYVDRDMKIKKFFDVWMDKIHSLKNFHLSYYNDYATDIKITQLDNQGKDVYSVILNGAFPKTINDLQLSANSSEPHSLDVNFAYWYWTPVEVVGDIRMDSGINNLLLGQDGQFKITFDDVKDLLGPLSL